VHLGADVGEADVHLRAELSHLATELGCAVGHLGAEGATLGAEELLGHRFVEVR
jgi:hypothetical protein